MVEALTKPLNLVTQSVTGNFTQTATGRLLIDIALLAPEGAPRNDLLTVTGTASLGGVVEPNIVSGLLPGRYIFLEAGQVTDVTATTTDGTLHSGAVPISWALVSTGDSIALTPQAHFTSPVGMTLTSDQRNVAQGLQDAWDGNTGKLGNVYARCGSDRRADRPPADPVRAGAIGVDPIGSPGPVQLSDMRSGGSTSGGRGET